MLLVLILIRRGGLSAIGVADILSQLLAHLLSLLVVGFAVLKFVVLSWSGLSLS